MLSTEGMEIIKVQSCNPEAPSLAEWEILNKEVIN